MFGLSFAEEEKTKWKNAGFGLVLRVLVVFSQSSRCFICLKQSVQLEYKNDYIQEKFSIAKKKVLLNLIMQLHNFVINM